MQRYKHQLQDLRNVYKKGENIMHHLKGTEKTAANTPEAIQVSYDLQAGYDTRYAQKHPRAIQAYTSAIAHVINTLGVPYNSILEAGVGEGIVLTHILQKLSRPAKTAFGFDIAWSRVKYALEYLQKHDIKNSFLCTGNLFSIPIADHAIDIVYTSHAIEPNTKHQAEILQELMRITKKYLILVEPMYEFADKQSKERMKFHGYVKNLHRTALKLKYNVQECRPFDVSINPLNPTGLLIIKQEPLAQKAPRNPLACPITKTPLHLIRGSYFSKESLLAYPIIGTIPCLLPDNAVIATHYNE